MAVSTPIVTSTVAFAGRGYRYGGVELEDGFEGRRIGAASREATPLDALAARPSRGRQNARKLSHLIARELRGMIVRGELAPNQALPAEADLVRAFEVSRDTLREALRILESESLIQVRRGRHGGAVVERPHRRSVTRHVALMLEVRGATVSEVQEARLMMEPVAAASLVDLDVDALSKLLELHDAELDALEDPRRYLMAQVAFDQAVFEFSGSATIALLSSVFGDLISGQVLLGGVLHRRWPMPERVTELHGGFIDAVSRRDARRAREAWAEYLTETTSLLADAMGDSTFHVAAVWRALRSSEGAGNAPDKRAASIATDIRIRIAEGKLRCGDQLPPLPELAAEFGVSRPTIREGLRILEVEGLVDLRTGSRHGATVLEPTAETAGQLAGIVLAMKQTRISDVVEARRLIEPSVIELVARRIDSATFSALSAGLAELEHLVGDTPAFIESFDVLERTALSAVRNPATSVVTSMIHGVLARCRSDLTIRALSLPEVIRSNRRACATFGDFLNGAQDGDPIRAVQAWKNGLDNVAPFYRSSFGGRLIGDLFE